MNKQNPLRKLKTALSLLSRGELISRLKGGETKWQKERRMRKWDAAKASNQGVRKKLNIGAEMMLYPGDYLALQIFNRTFEPDQQNFIKKYLRAGDIFVDVGANLGVYSLLAGDILRGNGQVYSFEPTPAVFQRLVENVEINKFNNVHCYPFGLSSRDESREILVYEHGYDAFNSFAPQPRRDDYKKELVKVVAWDSFARQHKLVGNVTLMKIDVEGWEVKVLEGASESLSAKSAPDLIVEFSEVNARLANSSCKSLYQTITGFGYQLYEVDPLNKFLAHHQEGDYETKIDLLATKDLNQVRERLGYRLAT